MGEVSRSGYYAWRDRETSARDRRREELTALVCDLFDHLRLPLDHGRPGTLRIDVDDETVRAIMRAEGMETCQPAVRPTTTISGQTDVPDLVRGSRPIRSTSS